MNMENLNNDDCYIGYHDGSCCCNCKHQKKLMCHPCNGNQKVDGWLEDNIKFGKGNISQQCGWICSVPNEDDGNNDNVIYFDSEHGICELHDRKTFKVYDMKHIEKIKNVEDFEPKISIKERYSLEHMAKSEGMTVEDFLENNRLREEYKQTTIKSFMDNGMDEEGAKLQTMRKMYIYG